jgi:hypothetical protein
MLSSSHNSLTLDSGFAFFATTLDRINTFLRFSINYPLALGGKRNPHADLLFYFWFKNYDLIKHQTKNVMKTKTLLSLLLLTGVLASCSDKEVFDGHKSIKIAVISDVHYMDPSLLKNGAENGKAFQDYLNADPKLVQYSDAIFKETIAKVKAESPDILLIAGDLTKDGELVSHQSVAALLAQFGSCTKVTCIPPK